MKFIDLHSHILPELDDGAQSMDEALMMLEDAYKTGTEKIVATPHTFDTKYEVSIDDRNKTLALLQKKIIDNSIPITILPGFECHLVDELSTELKNNKEYFINNAGKYVLLELPHDFIPHSLDYFLFSASISDYKVILAHPARNLELQNKIKLLSTLIEKGLIIQLTAGSFTNLFGRKVRKISEKLLKKNLVHIIASDAHDPNIRNATLHEAYLRICKLTNQNHADKLFYYNPKKIISRVT